MKNSIMTSSTTLPMSSAEDFDSSSGFSGSSAGTWTQISFPSLCHPQELTSLLRAAGAHKYYHWHNEDALMTG